MVDCGISLPVLVVGLFHICQFSPSRYLKFMYLTDLLKVLNVLT